jgi:hypothetical protein
MTVRALVLLLAVGLAACGSTDHDPTPAGQPDAGDGGPSDSGSPASCTCGPRPELGAPAAEPCGSTLCYQSKPWACGLSGWTEDVDAGTCTGP